MLHQVTCLLYFFISSIFYSISSTLSHLILIIPQFFQSSLRLYFYSSQYADAECLISFLWRRESALRIKTRLPSKRSGVRITAGKGGFLYYKDSRKVHPFWYRCLFVEEKRLGWKFDHSFRSKFRIGSTVPLFPRHAFVSWTETVLPCLFPFFSVFFILFPSLFRTPSSHFPDAFYFLFLFLLFRSYLYVLAIFHGVHPCVYYEMKTINVSIFMLISQRSDC
jgi:hypothetical protein